MATVILNHRVSNYTSWRAIYDADQPRRDAMGLTQLAVGEKHDDPGMVYMVWTIADASQLNQMMSDPELQKTMQEAGVISAPEVTILN
jgi:hypothetical protein